jgi:hypothetical protein
VNAGRNGDKLTDILARVPSITATYDFARYPGGVDVVLNAGINMIGKEGVPLPVVEQELKQVITALEAPNPKFVRVHLCTLEACVWDQKSNHSPLSPAEVTAEVNAFNKDERTKAT